MKNFSLLLIGILIPHLAAAQSPPKADSPSAQPTSLLDSATPADPQQRLEIGRELNGLADDHLKPWHLRADYEVFDELGKPTDHGVFEEWWYGANMFKVTYAGKKFSQQEFHTASGIYRSGNPDWLPWQLTFLRDIIEEPIPPPGALGKLRAVNFKRSLDDVAMSCSALTPSTLFGGESEAASYCFETGRPVLRFANTQYVFHQTIYNKIGEFQGRFIAHEARHLLLGVPALNIEITSLNLIGPGDPQGVDPPLNASPVPERIETVLCTHPEIKLTWVDPGRQHKPNAASSDQRTTQPRIHQLLTIVRIAEDGRVIDAESIAGPITIRGDFEYIARHRKYDLTSDRGPVEVEIEINGFLLTSMRRP
jgi:hypothetical protein